MYFDFTKCILEIKTTRNLFLFDIVTEEYLISPLGTWDWEL